jgi:hypothetical protein
MHRFGVMFKTGLAATITIAAIVIIVLWIASQAMGFEVSLWQSLALSIGLTLVVNFLMRGFTRRRGW